MHRQADVRANAHELHGRLICAIARSTRLQARTTTWHTQLHDLRDCMIRTAMQSARLRDMHDYMICMTVQSACLHGPHDYVIYATANPHDCGIPQGRRPSLRHRGSDASTSAAPPSWTESDFNV